MWQKEAKGGGKGRETKSGCVCGFSGGRGETAGRIKLVENQELLSGCGSRALVLFLCATCSVYGGRDRSARERKRGLFGSTLRSLLGGKERINPRLALIGRRGEGEKVAEQSFPFSFCAGEGRKK